MTDSGWKDGQRNVGASYILDAFAYRGMVRWHVWFNSGTHLHTIQRGDAADIDAAKRAAENALRDLCRETLAALGNP